MQWHHEAPQVDLTNTVVQRICIEVMHTLASESVGLIVTDPPYLINFKDRSGRAIPERQWQPMGATGLRKKISHTQTWQLPPCSWKPTTNPPKKKCSTISVSSPMTYKHSPQKWRCNYQEGKPEGPSPLIERVELPMRDHFITCDVIAGTFFKVNNVNTT